MSYCKLGLAVAAAIAPASVQAQERYGVASLSGIYSTSSSIIEDEIIDSSAVVGRVYGGLRWNPKGDTTRIQGSSSYYGYFNRGDRWSNSVEAEQQFRLSGIARIGLEASAASNISTLEVRSADQLAGTARLIVEPGDHRLSLMASVRRRFYDGSAARSWSPLIEADYRYRLGRYRYLDLEARHERNNSGADLYDYRRLGLAAYYTHPLGGDTRLRAGVAARRWKWDDRLIPGGERRRDRVLVPQARLTHPVTDAFDVELDYRYVVRRSNNDELDRNGHRVAATVRLQF